MIPLSQIQNRNGRNYSELLLPTSNNFIRDDIYLSERTTERIIFKDKENLPSPKKKVIELKSLITVRRNQIKRERFTDMSQINYKIVNFQKITLMPASKIGETFPTADTSSEDIFDSVSK